MSRVLVATVTPKLVLFRTLPFPDSRNLLISPLKSKTRSLLPSDHTGKAHGGEELLLRTPRPIRRQLKSVTNLVLGVISGVGSASLVRCFSKTVSFLNQRY
jgi:hypothetical protein